VVWAPIQVQEGSRIFAAPPFVDELRGMCGECLAPARRSEIKMNTLLEEMGRSLLF
jgi:hypothetical protein